MTEILIVWLNTEVDLTKKIKNLEEDFANGYYLGELLYKFNQLTNFYEFRNRDDRDSKLNNFCILQKVLSNIKVDFDSNKAKEIMEKKRGTIALLLYQIRTKLEKKGISMESISLKKSTHINELYQSKILGNKIEKYDKLNEKFFKERLARLIPAQKEIEMKRALNKFEDFRRKHNEIIKNSKDKEEADKIEKVRIRINDMRTNAQKLHCFNQEFEQLGIENWKRNMIKKKQMEEKDLEYQLKEAYKFQSVVNNAIKKSEKEVIRQIENFDELLCKLSKNEKENTNYEHNIHSEYNDSDYNDKLSYKDAASKKVNIINDKLMKNHLAKKERDRRRRKIIVEQSKAQLEIENIRREDQLIGKLFKYSNQEKQLNYETFRVHQNKEIIVKNNELRYKLYGMMEDMDKRYNEEYQKEYNRLNQDILSFELENEEIRRKDLSVSLKQNIRSKNTDYCKKIVDNIIEIADEAYKYQQVNDKEEFDDRIWREWTQLFVDNISVINKDYLEEIQLESKKDNKYNNLKSINSKNDINLNIKVEDRLHESNPANTMKTTEGINTIECQIKSNLKDKNIDNQKVENNSNSSMIPSANNTNFNTGFSNTINSNVDKKLDECELKDYITYKGQWEYKQIPSELFFTINLQDLMFCDQSDEANKPANKDRKETKKTQVKNTLKNNDEEYKEEDVNNLIIPSNPIKNELFGFLIDTMIEAKYSEENSFKLKEELENNNYKFIPIKISMFGLPFSGKKSLSNKLEKEFKLKIFDIEELIKLAIANYEDNRKSIKLSADKVNNFHTNDLNYNSNYFANKLNNNDNNNLNLNINNTSTGFQNVGIKQDINNTLNNELKEEDHEDESEQILSDRQNQIKDIKNKIFELGREIKSILNKGDALPDRIYSELIYQNIALNYPLKSREFLENEIKQKNYNINQLKNSIEEAKISKKYDGRPRAFNEFIESVEKEITKIREESIYGFCIVNYPNTYNQAKSLEYLLSGYIPDNERQKTLVEVYKEESSKILDKIALPEPKKKYIDSGLDHVFWIDTSPENCAIRAFGRRRDLRDNDNNNNNNYINKIDDYNVESKNNTNTINFYSGNINSNSILNNNENSNLIKNNKNIYHLYNNIPNYNTDICQNLVKLTENQSKEASFVTRCVSFENTLFLLKEFYEPFGFDEEKTKTLVKINGNEDLETSIYPKLRDILQKLLNIKEKKEEELIRNNDSEYEDEITLQTGDVDIDKQNSNIHDLTEREIIEASVKPLENNTKIDNNKNVKVLNLSDENVLDNFNRRIQLIKKQFPSDLINLLMKIWFRLCENYIRECKSVFKFVRKQRDYISNNYNILCQKFIEFLKRPSKKQIYLLEYQVSYNKFLDDFPDLKDDERVKDEHHQRVDDLTDKIFEIIEIRKAEAIDQRRKIITSNWIENEMEKFYHNLERLFQTEIDKFLGCMQIIRDFYHGLDNRILAEIPFYSIDIIKDEIDNTPIERDYLGINQNDNNNEKQNDKNNKDINNTHQSKAIKVNNNIDYNVKSTNINIFGFEEEYPRIEKLYRTCLKIQYQYDEMLFKSEKESQQAAVEKEAKEKKNGKIPNTINNKDKTNINSSVIANNIDKPEYYPHDEEMKLSLYQEKAKFRCRLTLLRYWGIKTVKNLRQQANDIYSKLEDWIILAIKAENEALTHLSHILKKYIEDEQKIKHELELDTFDIKINMDVVNYIDEEPDLLPAKELIDHNKFNIQQLNILINELKTYTIPNSSINNNIRTSNFLKIFEKKYITSKTDNDVYYGLPNSIKTLNFHNFYKFVKCFDPDSNDIMNLNHVLTLFCILYSPICNEEDEAMIKQQIFENNSNKVDIETFINLTMWFDTYESCETPPGYKEYNRVMRLKEIIFNINKDDNDMIDINDICDVFTLRIIGLNDNKYDDKTYFDVLFV